MALELKQSKSDFLPKLPVRGIIAGPSGAGKGILVSKLLLDPRYYRGCFERIYYISQSAKVDHNLKPLRRYCEDVLGQKEECIYDEFDEEMLRGLLARQLKLTEYLKEHKAKKGYSIAIIIDDFADVPAVVRGGLLSSLFVRGRHANISTFVLSQKYRALESIIRINCTALFFFRSRNGKDLEAMIEENSALAHRKDIEALYRKATAKHYGFLYIDLQAKELDQMFFNGLESRLMLVPP
jgi:hypothetical protein